MSYWPSRETTAGRSGPASVPDDKPVPEDSAPWPLLLLIDQIGSPIVTLAAAATYAVYFQLIRPHAHTPTRSFFAIDSEEQLYVWGVHPCFVAKYPVLIASRGTLDVVGFSSSSTPWFNPDMELSDPTKLVLPAATRAIRYRTTPQILLTWLTLSKAVEEHMPQCSMGNRMYGSSSASIVPFGLSHPSWMPIPPIHVHIRLHRDGRSLPH